MTKVPVEDRLDIQELCARYTFVCDTGKYDKMHEVFTDDASFDESVIGIPAVRGRAALRQTFEGEGGALKFVIHLNSNHLIHEYTGSTATGTTHLHAEVGFSDGRSLRILGYYSDEYVKTGGRWLIASRKLVEIAPSVLK